nr:MAG TPA: chitin biosynthesis protein [Caudoviricetes sp.]
MGYSASSNQPIMAITNRWYEAGISGGEILWKTNTAYVGYEGGPRNVSFTFPDLPTSNITVNNITVFIDADIEGDFKNRQGFVLTIAGTDYTAPPAQITISSGWTEALSSQTLTIPMRGKYTPSRTSSEGGSKPSSQVYITFSATAEWSYNYQTLSKPTNVSLSSTYITSSSSSTLSWDAVSNSPYANSVSGYQVYRDGQAYGQPTTGTSMSVSGATAGTYYDFTVKAISDISGYDSESSSSARLYIYGNDYSADLTLYTDKNSTPAKTIYIGDTG